MNDTNIGEPVAGVPAPLAPCPDCGRERDVPSRKLCLWCRLARRPEAPSYRRLEPAALPGSYLGSHKRLHVRIYLPYAGREVPTYAERYTGGAPPTVVRIGPRYWLTARSLVLAGSPTADGSSFTSYRGALHLRDALIRHAKLPFEGFWESDLNGIAYELDQDPAISQALIEAFAEAKKWEAENDASPK